MLEFKWIYGSKPKKQAASMKWPNIADVIFQIDNFLEWKPLHIALNFIDVWS